MRYVLVTLTLLTLLTAVQAGEDDLSPLDQALPTNGETSAQYCVNNITPSNSTIQVIVDPICRDLNGVSGCQFDDDAAQEAVTVVPTSDIVTIGGYGCTNLTITSVNATGTYYYTVNGNIGGVEISSETGSSVAALPEMSVVGSALVLLGFGVYLMKR